MISIDLPAILIAALVLALLFFIYRALGWEKGGSKVLFSFHDFLSQPSFKEKSAFLPNWFYGFGLGLLLLGVFDPHRLKLDPSKQTIGKEGIALYLVLDRSGSMGKVIDQIYSAGEWRPVTKWDLLKKAADQFIKQSTQTMIGVVAFARSAQVISPLTFEKQLLLQRVNQLNIVKEIAQDGTAIGYAIYKTAHLLNSLNSGFEIKKTIMVLITDGLQDPSSLDRGDRLRTMSLEDAASFAKEKNISIYIVNVEPKLNDPQYALNKKEMETIVNNTGGELIIEADMQRLAGLLNTIEKNEKIKVGIKEPLQYVEKIHYFPYFVVPALFLLALSFILEKTFWRRV